MKKQIRNIEKLDRIFVLVFGGIIVLGIMTLMVKALLDQIFN
jgi:hypothetical protein